MGQLSFCDIHKAYLLQENNYVGTVKYGIVTFRLPANDQHLCDIMFTQDNVKMLLTT